VRGETGITGGEERCAADAMGSGCATVVGVGCTSVPTSCVIDAPKQLVVGVGDGTAVTSALGPGGGVCTLSFCDGG